MPIIDETPSGFNISPRPERPAQPDVSFMEGFGAGFALENDVIAAVELLSRPVYEPKPDYLLGDDLRQFDRENGTDFFENYRWNFTGSQSPEETRSIIARIMDEQKKRDIASRAGFAGFAGSILGGIISPTSFIPLIGPATKARTAWQFAREAALIGAGVGAVQEGMLQAGQETRTTSESVFGIAAQTVLSGLLGGAVGHLTAREFDQVTKALNETTALMSTVRPVGAGAEAAAPAVPDWAAHLASGGVTATRLTDSNALTRNPVSYNVVQPMRTVREGATVRQVPVDHLQSEVARGATVQLSDGGFRFMGHEAGIPTAPGGTVEMRVQTHYNVYPSIINKLDEMFMDYRFEGNAPKLAPGLRAGLTDVMGQTNGKLTKAEFRAAITEALRNGDQHSIPQVAEVARTIRAELFDPMLREAQRLGLISKDIDLKGDTSWVFRDYDRVAIKRNTQQFVEALAKNFQKQLEDEFAESLSRFKKSQGRAKELTEDLQRPAKEVEQLKEQFLQRLKELDEQANAEHVTALEDTIAGLRAQARALRGDLRNEAVRKQLLADAREMEKAAGEPLEKLKAERADVRRRLRNLNRSYVVMEEKHAKKLERIENAEDLNVNTLRRAVRLGQRVLRDIERWSDDKLDAEVSKLKNQFASAAEVYDRGVERIVKLASEDEVDAVAGVRAEALQEARADRLTKIAERLEDAENLDRNAIRQTIQEMEDEALARIQRIVEKRAVRTERLRAQAATLDPALVTKRIEEINAKQAAREADFLDNWRVRGADDIDLDGGSATFRDFANEMAVAAKDRIMGTHLRLPSVSKMAGETRGSEIDRVLNIPSEPIKDFLENDIEKLMRTTLRTMAPDIELSKKFGSTTLADILGDKAANIPGSLADEMNMRLAQVKARADAALEKAKTPEEKAKIEKRLAKEQEEINDTFGLYRKNLEAMVGRLRNTWGLPQDPEALGTRLGRTMLNLNVLRQMGNVIVSSIPDVGRPVMRYGLTRVMRDGFLPMIANFKSWNLSKREVRWLAGGLDATMQSRASAVFDLLDDLNRGSKFETTIEYASRRMGVVALFDKWTEKMKEFSGVVAHAKLMDSVDAIVNGGSRIDIKEATRYLAENGIDADMAQRIWKQMAEAGGATKVNGLWWPNTAAWSDKEILRAYSAAITREVNNTIITPGIDKPLWIDSSMMGRILGQFKSFAFASTSRTLIAGLQQRDAAFVNGALMSLAFGALGYYVYGMSVGGKVKEEMLNAGPEKWADEAINRSGLLGILAEVQSIASRIPAVAPYATFSGTRSTRRGGDDLVGALLGPSFGAAESAANVLTTLHDPSEHTVHQMRLLLPFQNVFFLRQLFDVMEAAVPVND